MDLYPPTDNGLASRHSIAVLDNSWDLLRLMKDLLTEEGYDVDIMHATEGAHQRILESIPSLLILDMVLEKPDAGWQLLQVLKLDPITKTIPIIICSAASDVLRFHKEQIDHLGCYVLPKPFDIDHLLNMITTALNEQPTLLATKK